MYSLNIPNSIGKNAEEGEILKIQDKEVEVKFGLVNCGECILHGSSICSSMACQAEDNDDNIERYYVVAKKAIVFTSEYLELISEVRELDKEAAEYLENEAIDLSDFNQSYYLQECFYFVFSKQGEAFWWKLLDKLEKYRREIRDKKYLKLFKKGVKRKL